MPLDVRLANGQNQSTIDAHGNLAVSVRPPAVPRQGTVNQYRYLTGFPTVSGLQTEYSASANMNVDGSATPVSFYIGSSPDYDIYILGISILIADSAVTHGKFGALTPLTNGWDLKILEEGMTSHLIYRAKTGGQVIAQSGLARPYGDTTTAFELSDWVTGPPAEDVTTVWLPIGEYVPGGLRIGQGSNNRLVSTVNDDLSGLTRFTAQVFGYKHYPTENEV